MPEQVKVLGFVKASVLTFSPWWLSSVLNSPTGEMQETQVLILKSEDPSRRKWQSAPVLLPVGVLRTEEPRLQKYRLLATDTTERLNTATLLRSHTHTTHTHNTETL